MAVVAPGIASADGTTAVAATCSGLPLVGSTDATANVDATDDVDPVAIGGVVNNTLHVPIPEINVPVDVTVKKVTIKVPIPTGVTVNDVTFTPSSFTGQTWSVSGSVLTATFTGSVVIKNGGTPPVVPDVKMKTTVAGPARTVEWKVPTSIAADASWALGNFTATCVPKDLTQVLISTVVQAANTAPTATNQSVTTPYQTAKAVTLAGTDPESNPLTFAVASNPAHGTLSGTAPNLTYTPANGYSGPDSFTFTANDGSLTSTPGTVSITVGAKPNSAPSATNQSVSVAYQTAKAITLTGTDPESNPLTFAVASNPAHGTLSGTAPNLTYTPANG
ncbi:MAG: Ig-like domain-containing protein, partial [Aquihabitans sp.]